MIEGEGYFDPERPAAAAGTDTLIHFGDGDSVGARAESRPARFLLVSGKPLRERVAWHGPIVMNAPEEIRRALEDLDRGCFARPAR